MPAAALGASAKFRQDGRAERGRYHVALALPCGATDRALVADSALRAAKANNTAAVIKKKRFKFSFFSPSTGRL